jgi:hypothetical protein
MTAPELPAAPMSGDVVDAAGELVAVDPAPRPEDAGRLELDAALAELDRQPANVLEVEAAHGFVFGNPDGERGPGRHVAAVACSTPTCERQGRLHQVHDDTVLPVHCGACGAVMHCDHVLEVVRQREGTIGAPVEVTLTVCTVCGSELGRVDRQLPPIDLASLPAAILEQPLA